MTHAPSVIVFDVNETLSDMAPLAQRFTDVGAPAPLAKLWFATLLRDGFALAAAGDSGRFAEIGAEALRGLLLDLPLDHGTDHAVEHVMQGMSQLSVHPDVVDGVRALRAAGYRLVTLTNGATAVADRLFIAAGIRAEFERLLSVDDAAAWKPAPAAYAYAADVCEVPARDLLLVAVHPWDIHGASRAGLGTAWLNRSEGAYPGYFADPDIVVSTLTDLADALPQVGAAKKATGAER